MNKQILFSLALVVTMATARAENIAFPPDATAIVNIPEPPFTSGRYFQTLVRENRGGETKTLRWSDVPRRGDSLQSFLPLYLSSPLPKANP